MSILITASELHSALTNPEYSAGVTILDVRHGFTDAETLHSEYRAAHIPGAIRVQLATDLAGEETKTSGGHPLPTPEEFEARLRTWGVQEDGLTVVYGGNALHGAARAWLVLKWAGVPHVRFLDGGLRAWEEAGYGTETGEIEQIRARSTITVHPGGHPTIEAEEAARLAENGQLYDARFAYRHVSGFIAGSLNVPFDETVDEDDRFKSADQLQAVFAEHGAQIGAGATYCGGGVAAAHLALAAALLGWELPVYVGSYSEWIKDPHNPIDSITTKPLSENEQGVPR